VSVSARAPLLSSFLNKFSCDVATTRTTLPSDFLWNAKGAVELFSNFNGASFNEGLYRLHRIEKMQEWTSIACEFFTGFSGHVSCFAYDWLGRQFALDINQRNEQEPSVVMFEPGTGQALYVAKDFMNFHVQELTDHADAALAYETYVRWRQQDKQCLKHSECIGYRVPLFLNGVGELQNMERTDMGVYWEICSQLYKRVKSLPDGTIIGGVSLE